MKPFSLLVKPASADWNFQCKYYFIGRNAPCPCGNGKKYKHYCGKATAQLVQKQGSGVKKNDISSQHRINRF